MEEIDVIVYLAYIDHYLSLLHEELTKSSDNDQAVTFYKRRLNRIRKKLIDLGYFTDVHPQ